MNMRSPSSLANRLPSFNVPAGTAEDHTAAGAVGCPSDVLERRPDIASPEREMAYENAQVGLARDRFLSACHAEWSRGT